MSRVYNFSAGPAVLPEEVLQAAADEMMDYKGTGMSVMEMSHRSKPFEEIITEAEADLRDLMGSVIPAGWSFTAICCNSDEPDEKWCGRLHHYRTVGKKSSTGSRKIWKGKQNCFI